MTAPDVDVEKLEKIEVACGLEVLLLKKVDIRPIMLYDGFVLAQHKGTPVNVMWAPDFGSCTTSGSWRPIIGPSADSARPRPITGSH